MEPEGSCRTHFKNLTANWQMSMVLHSKHTKLFCCFLVHIKIFTDLTNIEPYYRVQLN